MANYQGVSLPKKILDLIDQAIIDKPYNSKAEFIRQAIRHELERVGCSNE